jgi:cysteine desulfurase
MKVEQSRLRKMRDRLLARLKTAFADIRLNGHPEYRLAGNLNVCIPGVESEALIIALTNDVAISSGSACTSAAVEPSHVLKALGLSDKDVHSSIRIGLGRTTTDAELEYAGRTITSEARRIRSLSRP